MLTLKEDFVVYLTFKYNCVLYFIWKLFRKFRPVVSLSNSMSGFACFPRT